MPTPIEWTDETWNPTRGCSRVSEGCRNCFAERQAARFVNRKIEIPMGYVLEPGPFAGFVHKVNGHPSWTGRVELVESKLFDPLHWEKPRRIFVNSMSGKSKRPGESHGLLCEMGGFAGRVSYVPTKLDWIIVGGESGPGARPFKLRWAIDVKDQCRGAEVAFFMKQVGSNSDLMDWMEMRQEDRKGGNWEEWPAEIRVREFPCS